MEAFQPIGVYPQVFQIRQPGKDGQILHLEGSGFIAQLQMPQLGQSLNPRRVPKPSRVNIQSLQLGQIL